MSQSLATAAYALGIVGLFYLNRDKSARTSGALWIPVIWFWILGSRAVSAWLGFSPGDPTLEQALEGSPIDAAVFGVLLASGIGILTRRRLRAAAVLRRNWPVILYFAYCLISVGWSDYPEVSLKRWVKATGDVVMSLVVLTDTQPMAAIRILLSRLGFVLVPTSVLLIKYYPNLGRGFEFWTGQAFNLGVTTNKNMLGVTTYILALGAFWQVLRLSSKTPVDKRFRKLLAQCALLALAIHVLSLANSATSTACFALGCLLMLATGLRRFKGRPAAVRALVLSLALLFGIIKITGLDTAVVYALGRKPDLTGRASEIWPLLLSMAPNPVIGAGFESFWLGPRLQAIWDAFPNLFLNEAHNGYIELYLNLGLVGVILVIIILVHGYRRSVAAFRMDAHSASLMLAYVSTAAVYSYTEAGFRMLSYAWAFLILFVMAATTIPEMTSRDKRSIPATSGHAVTQVSNISPDISVGGARESVTYSNPRT
jgi:exopolysaccharide production protein ExoQ